MLGGGVIWFRNVGNAESDPGEGAEANGARGMQLRGRGGKAPHDCPNMALLERFAFPRGLKRMESKYRNNHV